MGYYDSYKGRRGRRHRRLLTVIVVFLLLIILGTFGVFMLQDHVVFTHDGFYFDFQKPAAKKTDSGKQPHSDVPLVIEDGKQDGNPDDKPSVNPDDTSDEQAAYSAVLRTPAQIISEEALPDGCDAVAVVIKDNEGVMWVSDPMNAENGMSDQAEAFRIALSSVKAHKIAVVSALRDPLRPRYADRSSAVKVTSGAVWLDWDYCSWFSPYESGTAEYLKSLLQSCAEAGFDEVILTDFAFPVRGKTSLIDYGTQSAEKAETLAALAGQLKQDGLTVSCLLTDTAAENGKDEAAGQDAALLRDAFGKVWARCDAPEAVTSLSAQLGKDAVSLWLTQEPTTADLPEHIIEK